MGGFLDFTGAKGGGADSTAGVPMRPSLREGGTRDNHTINSTLSIYLLTHPPLSFHAPFMAGGALRLNTERGAAGNGVAGCVGDG